jgi:prevent-host-death family protein
MIVKEIISISDARKKIFKIADDVQKANNYYTLTEKGRAKVVMLSFDDFEAWMETLEVARMFPNLLEDTKQIDKDVKSGAYKNYASLEDVLREDGLLDKKVKNKHAVSNKVSGKSNQRAKKIR